MCEIFQGFGSVKLQQQKIFFYLNSEILSSEALMIYIPL